MKDILKMLRIQHYIKNILVFIPLFFSRRIFDSFLFFKSVIGFVCFCLISSAVYILNDIQDVENDRKHPKKKNRPIASGRVSIKTGKIVFFCCMIITFFLSVLLLENAGFLFLLFYFVLNVLYSIGGVKNKPIIDVVTLASGFVLRVIYGGVITNIMVSKWLYLVIISASLFMGLGKRRNELKQKEGIREVLKYYSEAFLDKNMYVCVTMVNVFYALWAFDSFDSRLIWTVPVVTVILMKYSFNIEGNSDGDPVDVLLHDKILMALSLFYVICLFVMIYIWI